VTGRVGSVVRADRAPLGERPGVPLRLVGRGQATAPAAALAAARPLNSDSWRVCTASTPGRERGEVIQSP